MRLTVCFDFGSPYSYLAWQRMRLHPERYEGADLEWTAVSAGHIFKMDGTRPNATFPNQSRYMWRDVERYARRYAVPFQPPREGPGAMPTNSIAAGRLHFLAAAENKDAAWREAVFLAYFRDGRDISDAQVLDALASEAGLSQGAEAAQDPRWKEALVRATTAAYAAGAPGVPYVMVGEGPHDVFWGQDRLEWVEELLATTVPSSPQAEDGRNDAEAPQPPPATPVKKFTTPKPSRTARNTGSG